MLPDFAPTKTCSAIVQGLEVRRVLLLHAFPQYSLNFETYAKAKGQITSKSITHL